MVASSHESVLRPEILAFGSGLQQKTEGGGKMKCVMCVEETEDKEQGICLECQKKVFKSLGMKVQFLDDDPFLKVTPKEKEPLYELITELSRAISNIDHNYFAINHHSHGTKEVPVVEIEKE